MVTKSWANVQGLSMISLIVGRKVEKLHIDIQVNVPNTSPSHVWGNSNRVKKLINSRASPWVSFSPENTALAPPLLSLQSVL